MGTMIRDSNFQDRISLSALTAARARAYAVAESRMRRGKRLVISGFVVAIVGVIGYCVAYFSAGANQELGSTFWENPGLLIVATMGTIGLGTLLWFAGSVLYLNGMMDGDPDKHDIY